MGDLSYEERLNMWDSLNKPLPEEITYAIALEQIHGRDNIMKSMTQNGKVSETVVKEKGCEEYELTD